MSLTAIDRNNKMKITKSQLNQIIYHEIKKSLNESNGDKFRQNLLKYFPEKDVEGATGADPAAVPDEEAQDAAFEKLRESMGLMEQAMFYMYSNGEEGQSPTEVAGLVQKLLPLYSQIQSLYDGWEPETEEGQWLAKKYKDQLGELL